MHAKKIGFTCTCFTPLPVMTIIFSALALFLLLSKGRGAVQILVYSDAVHLYHQLLENRNTKNHLHISKARNMKKKRNKKLELKLKKSQFLCTSKCSCTHGHTDQFQLCTCQSYITL